jgi:hypothetical protein
LLNWPWVRLKSLITISSWGSSGLEMTTIGAIKGVVTYVIARFPQFYSRIGFVHEFRPLDPAQVQELLEKKWTPAGVHFLTNNSSRRS